MKLKQRTDNQIELILATETRPRRRQPVRPYQRRRRRARWWFREMHRAVDEATDRPGLLATRGERQGTLVLVGGN